MIALGGLDAPMRAALERCLEDREPTFEDALVLSNATGQALEALAAVADRARRRDAGDVVTYVVNRNVNFTNVCVKACGFCAFSRTRRSEEGYFLPNSEIVRRVLEARELGATEVCIQAGLAPGLAPDFYVSLVRAIKTVAPELHVHALSPEEVKFAAELRGRSIADTLVELRDVGLGSLPGTSAEILDDRLRDRLAKGRITTAEWVDVVTTAHRLGIRTTSTMMYGHVETEADRIRHLELLRSIQHETGGFTEFVPLSFVPEQAPLTLRRKIPNFGAGAPDDAVIRVFCIARLVLGPSFRNVQTSWVKNGARLAGRLLACGANDLGGTLMNESISTSAGASHGQFQTPAALRAIARAAGRVPAERTTLYAVRRVFALDPANDPTEPLDAVANADAAFGSYARLVRDDAFRFGAPS